MLRFALVLASVLTIATGWSSGEPVSRYSDELIAFSHPKSWGAYHVAPVFHFRPIVYLSTQPIHDACEGRGSGSIRCSWPVDRLGRGDVLASWWEGYRPPPFKFSRLRGSRMVVGGRRAKMRVFRPGQCGQIGAAETISVRIERPGLDFQACLRGPGLRTKERQVRALLRSTIFQ